MRSLRARPSQRGFTLVEVLVAITILLVGVLGVVAMVDGANAVTNKNKAREAANSIARSIVEVGRAVPYKNLTDEDLYAALESRPGLNDSAAGGAHTISSAGFSYDVTLQVCSMDDPRDDLGTRTGTIEFCPDSDVWTVGNVDRNPDDYKRIAITLTWTRRNGTESVKQTSLVSNPIGGLGPTVIRLDPPAWPATPKVVTSPGAVNFVVETNTKAAEVRWAVDGATIGSATPVGLTERSFTFDWDIEGVSGTPYVVDGTYVIQAQAFDIEGRSGSPRALTVVLNRARPVAPVLFDAGGTQIGGGRNGHGTLVDIMWKPNPERDVLGYRVYRSITSDSLGGGHWTQVNCLGQSATLTYLEDPDDDTGLITCLDPDAPANTPLFYYVAAVDTAPGSSAPRESINASTLRVDPGNELPSAPANVSACVGGIPLCNDPTGDPAPDGATVLRWDPSTDNDSAVSFYRIYRDGHPVDGPTYGQRYGIFSPDSSGVLAWVDPDTPSGPHTYHVTAVADNFGESAPSLPVESFP